MELFMIVCGVVAYVASRLIELVEAVPNVIWSAVVASAITLFGVILAERNNSKRQMRQLVHDTAEKSKDRLNVARREIYLAATELTAEAVTELANIPQANPSDGSISNKLRPFFSSMSKAQLIADPVTSRELGEFVAMFGETWFRLVAKAMPVHDAKIDIKLADQFYDQYQLEIQRTLAEMTALNESGKKDDARFLALNLSFDNARKHSNEQHEIRSAAHQRSMTALIDFNDFYLNELKALGPFQVRVFAALRGELGIETDIADYERRQQENFVRMKLALEGLMEKLRQAGDK